jgi:transcriptional regulator with XRE-family HTH domain
VTEEATNIPAPLPFFDAGAFAMQLHLARQRKRLSLEEVARRVNELGVVISDASISGYERGERVPPADVFLALVLVLEPPDGMGWFLDAFRHTEAKRFVELNRMPDDLIAKHRGW